MLFNSVAFILVFLPITLVAYWGLRSFSLVAASVSLAAASFIFYSVWSFANLPILAGSIAFNFAIGFLIFKSGSRPLLVVGIAGNILLLGYFKYLGFLAENLSPLLGVLGAGPVAVIKPTLPIGISFYTFTQIAYLVDVYARKVHRQDPLNYILFVTYFPHLIAGPIIHHKEMMPQFADRSKKPLAHHLAVGLAIFSAGLFKKVCLADPVASYARPVFAAYDHGTALSTVDAWIGALSYTLQIYLDFSAYSDMAVGLSFMLGVRLPINFYSPYKATSIIDFWRRWHMTLSRFLRDYLYIPLGGNRKGEWARYRNLAITMLLGGLWHGAAWTFVLWGALHGLFLVANHLFNRLGGRLPPLLGGAMTFMAVVFAWVFFRAETLQGAIGMAASMLNLNGPAMTQPIAAFSFTLVHIVALLAFVWLLPNVYQLTAAYQPALMDSRFETKISEERTRSLQWRPSLATGVVCGLFVALALFLISREVVPSEFLYFAF